MRDSVCLEETARAVCEESAVKPLIFQVPPAEGRRRLEEVQNAPVQMLPAKVERCEFDAGRWGRIPVYMILPADQAPCHVIFYIHGAGWVFGSFHTHEKLVRELAVRTHSLVVFPEYSRSPEAQYPVAIEQCYHLLTHIWELTAPFAPRASHETLTVAGDSVGGNMAIAMALLAMQRGGPHIHKLLLYYPVTNACFDTPSYHRFAVGYYLYRAGMEWFWQQYAPCEGDRRKITVSPLRASLDCLRQMPATMIINGQADVLRSEGEAFGEKLRCAGVDVTSLCIPGIIHDFVMLNALDQTNACRTAMDASVGWINRRNETASPR